MRAEDRPIGAGVPIAAPEAWESARIGGRAALTHSLSAGQVAALFRLVEETRGLAIEAITLDHFRAVEIDGFMAAIRRELRSGKGAAIIDGLPADLPIDDFTRIHWGMGLHLGRPVIQNAALEQIVHVHSDPAAATGVTADFELKPHSEFHEILSLATCTLPESGGVSGLVSGLAIHNRMAQSHPELMDELYRGYWHVSPALRRMSSASVPVISRSGDDWAVFYSRLFQRRAAEDRGEEMPAAYREAIRVFLDYAEDPEIAAHFVLQPGEQVFWNNFTLLHSRSAFRDSDNHRRRLLRLWFDAHEPRAVVPVLRERAAMAEEDYRRAALTAS